jgi:hypothetical protein
MSKAPAFQFYPSDWQRDMDDHPLEIEGAWIRICCRLYWTGGTATKTLEEWSRILREKKKKTQQILDFFVEKNICDLVNQNGSITITSRRIVRDEYIRNIRKEAGSKGGNPHLKQEEKQELLVNQNDEQKPTPSSSSSSSKKKDLVSFSLAEDIDPDIWKAFVEHRRNLKKPLTEYAKKLILSKLDKIGQDKNAVLNQAIVKGWQDVFPLKDEEPMSSKTSFGLSPDEEKFLNEQEERERG